MTKITWILTIFRKAHTHLLVENFVAVVDVRDGLVRIILLLALLLANTGD